MNKLILCEGKTDAILLSYYLGKVADWKYNPEEPGELEIKVDADNQSAYQYRKNDDTLLICAAGGKDNFKNFFNKKITSPLKRLGFEKIAVVTDRDDHEVQEIENSIDSALESISVKLQNNKWVDGSYVSRFDNEKKMLKALLVVIPPERQGALEDVLLDAIAEKNECNRIIVEKTGEFAKQMRNELSKYPSNYLSNNSLVLKAHLCLTWAIQSPEDALTPFHKQIINVPWEESDKLRNLFSKLIEI